MERGVHVDICHCLYQGKTQWREGYMLTFVIACIRVRQWREGYMLTFVIACIRVRHNGERGLHVDICHCLYQGKTQWREGLHVDICHCLYQGKTMERGATC